MTTVKQEFNPQLYFFCSNKDDIVGIATRAWETSTDEKLTDVTQSMGYIGSRQIEEVWKHYYKEYYISNYGYIVKISKEDEKVADKIISQELKNADETSKGVCWKDFSQEMKDLFRRNAYVPKNRTDSGCQICLNITGKTAEYDIHRLVARFFLNKPEDYSPRDYVVHHIDNNSYNNSVTNLIYLKKETHQGEQHKIYHPMS